MDRSRQPQLSCASAPTGLNGLDRGELVTVNLHEPSEVATEFVAVDKAQVRHVLHRLARDLEDLALESESLKTGLATSRQERLADLAPTPPRLSPHEERIGRCQPRWDRCADQLLSRLDLG